MRAFIGWLVLSLLCLCLSFLLFYAIAHPQLSLAHYAWEFRALEILFGSATAITGFAAFYRWPARRRRSLPTAIIEPFRCVNAPATLDGNAISILLHGMMEQEGVKNPALEVLSSSPEPSFEFKLGQGGLSVSLSALKSAWNAIRAREVIRVRGIIFDTAKPVSIVVSIKGVRSRYPVADNSPDMEVALFGIARVLLQHLAPTLLARRYYLEGNYPKAIQVYHRYLAQVRNLREIELDLSRVELESFRINRALTRLKHIHKKGVPRTARVELSRLMADAHFRMGDYEECKKLSEKMLKEVRQASAPSWRDRLLTRGRAVALVTQEAAFCQLLASVYTCQDKFGEAAEQWGAVTRAIVKELERQFHSSLEDWSHVEDEISAGAETSELFPLVYNLCWAWLNRALCFERLGASGRDAAVQGFESARNALRPLNVVDSVSALRLAPRCYLAYARHWERQENKANMTTCLETALKLGDEASRKMSADAPNRPDDISVTINLAWIHLRRFDSLHRMIQSGIRPSGSDPEELKDEALRECGKSLTLLSGYHDKSYQAEAGYGWAGLWAVQSDAPQAAKFLGDAIRNTSINNFSHITNSARMDETFDLIRETPEFQRAIARPPIAPAA